MNHIKKLITDIIQIEKKHRNNECYYNIVPRLGDYYDWQLPPEYKSSLFGNKKVTWNSSSDMYYFMIKFYEQVTGNKPEVNFQMNNIAVINLMRCLDVDEREKEAVAWLFVRCTEISESRRIKNASEFKNTEAFRLLVSNQNR